MKKGSQIFIYSILAVLAPIRVASDGVCVRSLAPGQCNFEETSQRWRAVGDSVSDLTEPVKIFRSSAPITASLSTSPTLMVCLEITNLLTYNNASRFDAPLVFLASTHSVVERTRQANSTASYRRCATSIRRSWNKNKHAMQKHWLATC